MYKISKSYLLFTLLFLAIIACTNKSVPSIKEHCACFDSIVYQPKDRIDYEKAVNNCLYEVQTTISETLKNEPDTTKHSKLEGQCYLALDDCDSYVLHFNQMDKLSATPSPSKIENAEDCAIMKNGKFENISWDENISISKTPSEEVITYWDRGGVQDKLKIEWIDSCSYKMTLTETTDQEQADLKQLGDTYFVRILEVRSDTVTYELNLKGFIQLGQLRKIEGHEPL